ncbi:MAG: glycosyltransferase [Muribaculaceae bacterium]|nr:glycosyltransferase [Muribaculaceae bacterium]
MKTLKIRFEDIDNKNPFLKKQPEYFINILKQKYNVIVLKDNISQPDVLFFSCWGSKNNVKWTNCLRIYFTAERDIPNFNICDYAIGLVNIGESERFLHFPFYVFYNNLMSKYEQLELITDPNKLLNRSFCSAVITDSYRNPIFFEFFHKLNEYKTIDCGGKWNNNVGGAISDKLDFIKNYKFNIAFENTKVDGYVTEKIIEPLVAQTIPIYWGSNSVKNEFGEGSYINVSDFKSLDDAVNFVIKLDLDNSLYLQTLTKRASLPLSYEQWNDKILNFLVNAIENKQKFFDPRCNRNFEEIKIYHIIHTSLPGKAYRFTKKLKYKLFDYLKK